MKSKDSTGVCVLASQADVAGALRQEKDTTKRMKTGVVRMGHLASKEKRRGLVWEVPEGVERGEAASSIDSLGDFVLPRFYTVMGASCFAKKQIVCVPCMDDLCR